MKKIRSLRVALLTALVTMGALFPIGSASAAPTIEFLNPSDYSPTLTISNKENGETTYHLVAWALDIPATSLVEFELAATPGITPDEPVLATVTGTKVGADTYEGTLVIPSNVTDGQYFLRAILYSGSGLTAQEVDRDQVTVQVNDATPPPQANTAELTYPSNGGPAGFWRVGTSRGIGVFTGFASEGTVQVRAAYTTTNVGQDPEWVHCGSAAPNADEFFRVRCTLAEGTSPAAVKAVAVAANQTPPPADAAPAADETGDAHRVLPYLQTPTLVAIDPASSQTELDECTPLTMTVEDQSGVPIAAINVDVHAQGPSDQLRFSTQRNGAINVHSPFQAPDTAHGSEAAHQCVRTDPEARQGDHNVPAGHDIKHIESTNGTNNQGQFTFILHDQVQGGTAITAWADRDDDDSQDTDEARGLAQLGWGTDPPQPSTELIMDPSSVTAEVGACQRIAVTARQGSSSLSGRNIDVHVTNPSGVAFCNPGDSTVAPPDGTHSGDPENTQHAEGTSNSSGQVIFGVTSPNSGSTSVTAWLDDNGNESADSNETLTAGTIQWQSEQVQRSISLQRSKGSVEKGSKVTLSGQIEGPEGCVASETVRIRSRRGDRRFRTIKTVETDNAGTYSTKVVVRRTKDYRAVAPKAGDCNKARSNIVTVRARN